MGKPTLYISGPMTGVPESNIPAFLLAEVKLCALGYLVFNPARHPKGKTWQEYMRLDIADLLQCGAVAFLPGWSNSKGALIERQLALDLDMPLAELTDWLDQDWIRENGYQG